jgi:glycosyltransferase involved in cell wall biosynthesis
MLKLYLVFPYRGVGGVSMLFLRLAEYLAQHGLAECHLVDYADGFMARNVKGTRVHLECYEDQGKPVDIPADAVALFQSMTPWSIFPGVRLAAQTRVFFWNCYPFNLVPFLPGLRREMQHSEAYARLVLGTVLRPYRNKIRKLIALLLSKRALVFMDSPNLLTTERHLVVSVPDPGFVPIPVQGSNNNQIVETPRDFSRQLRVVWVGRVVDFKFYTLHRALIELNRLQPSIAISITVTIVGSGDYSEQLGAEATKLTNLTYRFIDHIPPQDLDDFVVHNTDLLIAMGTSALEGARLGVPTLLLDVAHARVSADYVFSWLYERKGFTLGDVVSTEHFVPSNDSMASRIRELIDDFPRVSAMSRNYTQQNHDIEQVAGKLLQTIASSSCTYGDLNKAGLLGRGLLYSILTKIRKKVA